MGANDVTVWHRARGAALTCTRETKRKSGCYSPRLACGQTHYSPEGTCDKDRVDHCIEKDSDIEKDSEGPITHAQWVRYSTELESVPNSVEWIKSLYTKKKADKITLTMMAVNHGIPS